MISKRIKVAVGVLLVMMVLLLTVDSSVGVDCYLEGSCVGWCAFGSTCVPLATSQPTVGRYCPVGGKYVVTGPACGVCVTIIGGLYTGENCGNALGSEHPDC